MQDSPRTDDRSGLELDEGFESIFSTSLVLLNRSRNRLAAVLDQQSTTKTSAPVVILVSGYGKTKSSHLRLGYYLAYNGFRVIRYDHSNHIGESDGPILLTTLSQMAADLEAVIDFVAQKLTAAQIGVVAESLGARAALKVASYDRRVGFFASLIGVFDVQDTLRTIYGEDGFVEKMHGVDLGIRDIMGFQVDSDRFVLDACHNGFHSIESAERDAANSQLPTYFFVAENDPWVDQESVRRVFASLGTTRKKKYLLPGVMHELYENPIIAADTCCEIVKAVQSSFHGDNAGQELIRVPPENSLVAQSRIEKRARSKDMKTAEEKPFWTEYLEKYSYIVKLQDYWNLLESIGSCLGAWKRGERILDAGCGIGNFGTFLLVRHLYQALQLNTASLRRKSWAQYVGIDFVHDSLIQAKAVHQQLHEEFGPRIEWALRGTSLVDFSYSVVDLNCELPFKSQCFDKIISNLVLSYVKDPEFTLSELCRTLKVGGRIVITTLKPNADLSRIYRNYASVSRTTEEIRQARMVLSNAGLIKHKEAEGFYQFFSEFQLTDLLQKIGCHRIVSFRSFGDQANVAVAEKPSL